MAASATISEETFGTIKKIKWTWVAHTDGVVAVATANAESVGVYTGTIERLVTVPNVNAPSDNYTVIIYDDDDTDVLMGAATANRDTANTEQVLGTSLGVVANDKLTLYISGAGSGNEGTVYLYIR